MIGPSSQGLWCKVALVQHLVTLSWGMVCGHVVGLVKLSFVLQVKRREAHHMRGESFQREKTWCGREVLNFSNCRLPARAKSIFARHYVIEYSLCAEAFCSLLRTGRHYRHIMFDISVALSMQL